MTRVLAWWVDKHDRMWQFVTERDYYALRYYDDGWQVHESWISWDEYGDTGFTAQADPGTELLVVEVPVDLEFYDKFGADAAYKAMQLELGPACEDVTRRKDINGDGE